MSFSETFRRLRPLNSGQGPSGNSSSREPTEDNTQNLSQVPAPEPSPDTQTENVQTYTSSQSWSSGASTAITSSTHSSTKTTKRPRRGGREIFKRVGSILGATAGSFGPFKKIADLLLVLGEMILGNKYEGKESDQYEAMQVTLEALFEDLEGYLSTSSSPIMTKCMISLCKDIQGELEKLKLKFFKRHKGQGTHRFPLPEDVDEVHGCYQRVQSHVQRLTLNVNLSTLISHNEQTEDNLLDRLGVAMASIYNSTEATSLQRGPCTEGTRVEVLGTMNRWVYNSPAGAVFWLNGMAGTGKTTITYSLCDGLDTALRLAASFFCSRLLPDCRNVGKIIPSIAYQLARFSRPFCHELLGVLKKDRDVHKRLIKIQFESLLVGPLDKIKDALPTDLVVVIDALDECDDKDSTRQIIDLVLNKSWNLPIKFLVSSRPEPQIRDEMVRQGGTRAHERIVLHELDQTQVQTDIRTYLWESLRIISPSNQEIAELVDRSGVLFIYAATAVRYIGHDNFQRDPRGRLASVLGASGSTLQRPDEEIGKLYTMILNAAFEDPDLGQSEKEEMRLVLNTVVCAQEPLTVLALFKLLNLRSIERVRLALRPLWSVLHVMEETELVTTLHASFPDYIHDSRRSKTHYCSEPAQNLALAGACFDCVANMRPQFNICALTSSYMLDKQVPKIAERIQEVITVELFYACRYWIAHLSRATNPTDLAEQLGGFFSKNLFLWMEVMNLKKSIHTGADILWQAEDFCTAQGFQGDIIQLVHDAWRFTMTVASSPISQSMPHIYVSMLPFWPQSSPILKCYGKFVRGVITPVGRGLRSQKLSILASWDFSNSVMSSAFSPDATQIVLAIGETLSLRDAFTGEPLLDSFGKHSKRIRSVDYSPLGNLIVSGSDDTSICVWDPSNGNLFKRLTQAHTKAVTSVKFSPDGSQIVSGSQDNSIRLWDAQTGHSITELPEYHRSWVTSVEFSPDGTCIISGSSDNTVRVWDKQDKRTIFEIKGHNSRITSARFSPDGTRIVSGSYDKTVCVWDARTGKQIGNTFRGHSGRVTTIGFSPDGSQVASGSEDKTIRVWDVRTGKTVLGPLSMHTGPVTSVSFSKRGSHLVSTSTDKRVVIWDTRRQQVDDDNFSHLERSFSQTPVLSGLEGHTSTITSVLFSPDGTRIVSSSEDQMVRVWSVRSGLTVTGPLVGHTYKVNSIAISPNGARIASGSSDQTLRVWDSQTGEALLGPLRGHANWVMSVAFSSDSTRIVSGSADHTVCVWDSQTGNRVLGPLKGHAGWVDSVVFSPDGNLIVSGSRDHTIGVRSSQDGRTVQGPLCGHTHWVSSVAISSDGSRIVSGSRDKTIRVWDLHSGQMVLGPLKGHTDHINSVAFSPDCTRIVSGSEDTFIYVWMLQGGKKRREPLKFKGHFGGVKSVAFSPDGTYIVSGSSDRTIVVWNLQDENKHAKVRYLQALDSKSSESSLHSSSEWTVREDGWAVDDRARLVVFIPSDLRSNLVTPKAVLRLPHSYFHFNIDEAQYGDSWVHCFWPS